MLSAEICKYGLMTPVGLDAVQSMASVRAGICRFAESKFRGSYPYEPLVLSLLPDEVLIELREEFAARSARVKRLLTLACEPLQAAVEGVDCPEKVPLFLGLPEALYEGAEIDGDQLLDDLLLQADVSMDRASSQAFAQGRAAGFAALEKALEAVQSGQCTYAVAGAVDSYADARLLSFLQQDSRIKYPGVMDGSIPGEGAGFILVGAADAVAEMDDAMVRINHVKTGFEPGHLYSDEPYRGEALSDLFRALLRDTEHPVGKIRTMYAGFNGERYHTKEAGIAKVRHEDLFEDEYVLEHPADCVGDAGAALGIIMVALAADDLQRKKETGPTLIWGSSDMGTRGVALLECSDG